MKTMGANSSDFFEVVPSGRSGYGFEDIAIPLLRAITSLFMAFSRRSRSSSTPSVATARGEDDLGMVMAF